MKIFYVVTAMSGDELSIIRALEYNGHIVHRVYDTHFEPEQADGFDFVLFNHSKLFGKLSRCKPPKVAWVFDLITHEEFQPEPWMSWRPGWAQDIIHVADLAFFTDGDFVKGCPSHVHWLTQGCQEIYRHDFEQDAKKHDLLLAASVLEGSRAGFLGDVRDQYGDRLKEIIHARDRVYGRDFAKLIYQTQLILAPHTPTKANYWSNRVWMVLGYGGCLLHPYIETLAGIFEDKKHIVYYHDKDDLFSKIDMYLDNPELSHDIGLAGMVEVAKKHTYQHRVDDLLETLAKEGIQ